MNIDKKKLVFGMVILTVLIFLITYSITLTNEDENEVEELTTPLVPELEEEGEQYTSKLDAINDLKEVRQTTAPSIYDEKLMDSLGYFDPEYESKEKERIVDSIYAANRIQYSNQSFKNINSTNQEATQKVNIDSSEIEKAPKPTAKELGLDHQLFFASAPIENKTITSSLTDPTIHVVVDGDQVVKTNSRLRMRLTENAIINDKIIPKNTSIFGFISFQPNRALIEIKNINHHPTKLNAYDLQDGSEGIYVENNFRAEATNEVLDDIIQDINIPSVPQINGISQVLRRRNRNVKVTVLNNYKLILKPKL